MNAYDLQTPGPNAPYPWLRTTLEALSSEEKAKILLGIPFYGYDNAGSHRVSTGLVRQGTTILILLVSISRCCDRTCAHRHAHESGRQEDPLGRRCQSRWMRRRSLFRLLGAHPPVPSGVFERVLREAHRRSPRGVLPVSPVPLRPTAALRGVRRRRSDLGDRPRSDERTQHFSAAAASSRERAMFSSMQAWITSSISCSDASASKLSEHGQQRQAGTYLHAASRCLGNRLPVRRRCSRDRSE